MKYFLGFPLVLLVFLLQILPPPVRVSSASLLTCAASTPHLSNASAALAYHIHIASGVAPAYSPVASTSEMLAHTNEPYRKSTQPLAHKATIGHQDPLAHFLDQVSTELIQAWRSIRTLFR